ncbi:MAG: HTH domain-containing protein [Halanaerobium sp.]|nr:HTH domain-containing protein [Halanaerobium sp.]
MKVDRLIGIVMYLLNRDLVTARTLAERFEVSVRTLLEPANIKQKIREKAREVLDLYPQS